MEFHGQIESVGPEEVVSAFEETISMASEGSRSENAEQTIQSVWQAVKPS